MNPKYGDWGVKYTIYTILELKPPKTCMKEIISYIIILVALKFNIKELFSNFYRDIYYAKYYGIRGVEWPAGEKKLKLG